jgi:serine/threonine-protein kinase
MDEGDPSGRKLAPTDATFTDATMPGKVGHARQADFPRDWPRYAFVDFLGEGAMGTVYKARDLTLQRIVAIKFMRGDDADRRRFAREAVAQARIDHPHVCKVYEVGEVEARPFVAMQLIEGKTLTEWQPQLTLREKLQVMQKVCDGLAAAHALGIVHRDLKPGNIMCERRSDGSLVPFVMDFGLARDPRDVTLTQSHALMGTPAFMPPEQARGHQAAIDARSDVYALGATLYALLAGHPPFDSPSLAELIVKVLSDPPPRLGRLVPSLPADVETIVMKCLEKEPARRYDSTLALGADLGRFLDGRPIAARRPSRVYRARLFLRRHRAPAAVALLAALISTGLVGWLVKTRLDARRVALLAARFGREATELEASLRVAALMPEHDVTRDRDAARQRLRLLADEVTQAGPLAAGPGAYALGRGYLAVGAPESARAELERAWAAGTRSPDVAYALGATWERLWENDHDEAAREAADERDRQREREARRHAGEWLAQAGNASVISAELLEAKVAYVADKLPEARKQAQAAFAHDPLLFEARLLEGRVSSKLGHKLAGKGDLAAARLEYGRAETVLLEAAQIARSDPETMFQLCRLYDRMLELPRPPGSAPSPAGDERAIAACRRAVHVDPASDAARGKLAIALERRAELALDDGHEAGALLDEARLMAERAIALQPRFINHYRVLANTLRLGGDFDGAIAVVKRGLDANPDPTSALKLELTAARIETQRGRDRLAHRQAADEAVAAALAAVARARVYQDDYRVALVDAGARTLAAAAAVAEQRDATALIAAARAAVARTLALTHEETPALKTFAAELDGMAAPRKR